jgi:hypothetical protein
MAIALYPIAKFWLSLHGAVHWLSGAPSCPPAISCNSRVSGLRAVSHVRPAAAGQTQRSWGGPIRAALPHRPLRVVRVVEPRHSRVNAGRMVISGRMADVCAELDRLAALETGH